KQNGFTLNVIHNYMCVHLPFRIKLQCFFLFLLLNMAKSLCVCPGMEAHFSDVCVCVCVCVCTGMGAVKAGFTFHPNSTQLKVEFIRTRTDIVWPPPNTLPEMTISIFLLFYF